MLSNSNAAFRYRSVQVTTCSPGQLLVMLYDGLYRFMREAETAMRENDRAKAGEKIGRAHAILEQLLTGLDPSHAPELCAMLQPLYIFCMRQLLLANAGQKPEMIAEVARVLTPLREAWREAVASLAAAESAVKAGNPVLETR